MTLNEEYAYECKGWRASTHDMSAVPDYTTSDAELGRMVKALSENEHCPMFSKDANGFYCDYDIDPITSTLTETFATVNEAAMRACIALKLPVPEGAL